jgi:hypothetical protein
MPAKSNVYKNYGLGQVFCLNKLCIAANGHEHSVVERAAFFFPLRKIGTQGSGSPVKLLTG